MIACVLLDHLLLDRAQTGGLRGHIGRRRPTARGADGDVFGSWSTGAAA